MEIRGAIFDMDGTLVDSLGLWDILWTQLGLQFFNDETYRPDKAIEKAIRTLTLQDGMLLLHQACGVGASGEALLRIANDIFVQFYSREVKPKAGVQDFLVYLKEKGVKMCIASATAPFLVEIALNTCGLKPFFSNIFSCSEIGKGKEYPDVFISAHTFLGTPKESTWIFEDSIVALETAKRASYHTVGVYDQNNFNIDQVAKISTVYLAKGESFTCLKNIFERGCKGT